MQWKFDSTIGGILLHQAWYFTSNAPKIITIKTSSPGMELEMPSTLVLKKNNRTQNSQGIDEFEVTAFHMTGGAKAAFFISCE